MPVKKVKPKQSKRLPLACLIGSIVLYLLLTLPFLPGIGENRIDALEREAYGGTARTVAVIVKDDTGESIETEIEVQPRAYTKQEAQEVFDHIMEDLGARILLNNASLQEIRSDLNLITALEAEGIRLRWQTDISEYLSYQGAVKNEELPAEGITGLLKVQLRSGEHKADYELPVCVLPPNDSHQEQLWRYFLRELRLLDELQKEQPVLQLLSKYEGRSFEYYLDSGQDYRMIPLLGAVLAILLYFRSQEQEKQRQKERERQMLLDYSEVLTKLVVFIGAGMTVRLCWERIVGDYRAGREAGRQKQRYVYEEMCHTNNQLQSGVPEGRAYQEFGERCRLQPYLKLSSLLEQNRKTGTKNLRKLMQQEVEAALEQRMNLAKRLGEEASIKLTGPLFLMLGVIMILVLFPAMMNMQS